MPLIVDCPNGCIIRMPLSRAGRIVRCPRCKSALRIPSISESVLNSGKPVPCIARIARRIKPEADEVTPAVALDDSPIAVVDSPPATASQTQSAAPRLPVPTWVKPVEKRKPRPMPVPEPSAESAESSASTAQSVGRTISGLPAKPASIQMIDLDATDDRVFDDPAERNWEDRLEHANTDRKYLAWFFAMCLCCVAIINIVPALYHWYSWTQLAESMPLPRWIYIQIFVGAIHLVYAIFLAQIPNWSAMRAVSVAMLAVAFVFGFISTGLLIGGGQGNLTGFLGIPYTLSRQACIWCVAMLCLATLMSYWGGKESSNWERSEHLLKEILSKSTAQA